MFKSMKKVFASSASMFKDAATLFEEAGTEFDDLDKEFEDLVEKEGVTIQREQHPDGSVVITKTVVTRERPQKQESQGESTLALQEYLWTTLYGRVQKFWPHRATILSFDGKHYGIGIIDLESRKFDVKGSGDSLEDAVRDVERKFDKTR